jgi:hypothetical protein
MDAACMNETAARKEVVEIYRGWISGEIASPTPGHDDMRRQVIADIPKLRGKNLACFCPLDQCCHADVLLEIANS